MPGEGFPSHHPSRHGSGSLFDIIKGVLASPSNSASSYIALAHPHFAAQELPLL